MATPIRLRTETLADPIAAWDELEAGITFLEEEIHAQDVSYTVTPFVPGQRLSTWVMTKAEIQGLEDRMHAVSVYLGIPHLLTTWSGLMPVGYNAMNHFILGLKPQAYIDYGFDTDGDLYDIMPVDYNPATHEIDWISMFKNETPKDVLTDLITSVQPVIDYDLGMISAESVFNAADTRDTGTAALDATHSVIAYQDYGNSIKGTAVVALLESGTLSFGAETIFSEGQTYWVQAIKIDATHVLIVYSDYSDGYQGKAVIGTIDGTTVSFGLTYAFCTDAIDFTVVSLLDSTHAIMACGHMAMNDVDSYGAARIAVIDGNTLSFGSEAQFNVDLRTAYLKVQALDSTHAVIAFQSENTPNYGSTIVAVIDGSTISFGDVQAFDANYTYIKGIGKLDSTHVCILYSEAGNKLIVASLSGTTLSFGSPYTLVTSLSIYPALAMLDGSHAIVCADSSKAIDVLTFVDFEVTSHHSTAINEGSTVRYTSIGIIDEAHAVVVYQDYYNSAAGTAALFTAGVSA